jgi:DNA-binding FrmR family transcriptional regulator
MIEAGRPCLDLAQQLHAVERAVNIAKKTLIHDHIDHCLEISTRRASARAGRAFDEFKEITKYL